MVAETILTAVLIAGVAAGVIAIAISVKSNQQTSRPVRDGEFRHTHCWGCGRRLQVSYSPIYDSRTGKPSGAQAELECPAFGKNFSRHFYYIQTVDQAFMSQIEVVEKTEVDKNA